MATSAGRVSIATPVGLAGVGPGVGPGVGSGSASSSSLPRGDKNPDISLTASDTSDIPSRGGDGGAVGPLSPASLGVLPAPAETGLAIPSGVFGAASNVSNTSVRE